MKAVTLLVLLLVVSAATAQAQSTISEIATELQDSPVYVGPGFPDVDVTDIGRLKSQLYKDDTIVLVLLPEADYGAFSAEDLAEGLSEELGDQYIIGLALDKEVVAYAPMLPEAVSADLMQRAVGLSNNNPVTALVIFVQNVHKWQAKNPAPTPTPAPTPEPAEQSTEEGSGQISSWLLFGSGAGIFVCAVGAMFWFRMYRRPNSDSEIFNERIGSTLTTIRSNGRMVRDRRLQHTIEKLIADTNRYLDDGSKSLAELANLHDRLADVDEILVKYLDIQDHPQYYRRPDQELVKGSNAIGSFGEAVYELILQNSDRSLADYRLDTNILEAEKEALYL